MRKKVELQIIRQINRHEFVSFDLYDTLLKRNVSEPADVFGFLGREGEAKYGKCFSKFKEDRIAAEYRAREKVDADNEITLADIYDNFQSGYSKEMIQWATIHEIEYEYGVSVFNDDIKRIYDYCVENNKKIIIISDMYLPESYIVRLLQKLGIDSYNYLFLSSSYNATKARGKLYDIVLSRLNISPKQMIHIGDNKKSDYYMAKKKGIDAILLPKKTFKNSICEAAVGIDDLALKALLQNYKRIPNVAERQGFYNFGPLLYGFSTWLNDQVVKEGISKIYFFSRDGLILKRAFDILNNNKRIETHYFFASRRALQVPAILENTTYEEFIKRICWPRIVELSYFIKSMGVDDKLQISQIVNKYDVSSTYKIARDCMMNDKLFYRIWGDYHDVIVNNAQEERRDFENYVKKEGLEGKVAIVDIGWHGNMQCNLEMILRELGIDHNIYGYYVGIKPENNYKSHQKMLGYAFDGRNNNLCRIERDCNQLFEQIFMANHGSVHKYSPNIVELYENEQISEESKNIISKYQKGALALLKELNNQPMQLRITREFALYGVLNQFIAPTSDDVELWGDIVFKDVEEKRIISSEKIYKYFLKPSLLWFDMNNSIWKIGFLKKIFKLKIPYYSLLLCYRKIRRILINNR